MNPQFSGPNPFASHLQPQQPAPRPQPVEAQITPSDEEVFVAQLVYLWQESERVLGLPLDIAITMITRHATNLGLPSNGKLAIYAGLSGFNPDAQTLRTWAQAYVEEVKSRQQVNTQPDEPQGP